MFFNIPNTLTWARIAAIPLLLAIFYFPWGSSVHWQNLVAAALFAGFGITDWLDGYLARKLGQTSQFGAFLDPVADKFLVCASLLVLVHLQRVDVWIAFITIGREIAISALREWMALVGAAKHIAVHFLGKLKTALQMVAITLLLLNDQWLGIDAAYWGTLFIWGSTFLTVWSMLYYLRKSLPDIRSHMGP
jgi:cardiolipin synthase